VDEFGGEGDTLYVGGTHTRDLGKLHASRAAGRYARRASQSTQESRQEVPTQVPLLTPPPPLARASKGYSCS